VKIALDPYMFREVTTLQTLPGVVADLGFEWIELSPREDFTPFFTHPRVGDAGVKEFGKALRGAGVGVSSVLRCTSGPARTRTPVRRRCATGSGPSR